MRHNLLRTNHNTIFSLDNLSSRESNGALPDDRLNHSLGYPGCLRREEPGATGDTEAFSPVGGLTEPRPASRD